MIELLVDKFKRKIGNIVNYPRFSWKKVTFGYNKIIYGQVRVYGPKNRVSFGDNCTLRSSISSNPLGGASHIILCVRGEGRIRCGNNVGISNSCIRITREFIVEDNVNIGGDCKIYDSDMHSVEYEARVNLPDNTLKEAPIRIKQGAWIGAQSIILKGVTIGARSVIGAGSVVTKDVPDDELWAGNPAKFVKKIDNHVRNQEM